MPYSATDKRSSLPLPILNVFLSRSLMFVTLVLWFLNREKWLLRNGFISTTSRLVIFFPKISPNKTSDWSGWPSSLCQRVVHSEEGEGSEMRGKNAKALSGHRGRFLSSCCETLGETDRWGRTLQYSHSTPALRLQEDIRWRCVLLSKVSGAAFVFYLIPHWAY